MVISKCVPLEISRKKFSDFLQCERLQEAQTLFLVGYDEENGVKKNKKLKFSDVKTYIDNVDNRIDKVISSTKGEIDTDLAEIWKEINALKGLDDEGVPTKPRINEVVFVPAVYKEEDKCALINLNNTLSCVEINGGGEYTTEFVLFDNPIFGAVTRIVIDNSGRINDEGVYEAPVSDFILYYGINEYERYTEIATVPIYQTCIVEVLHTSSTDIIINTTYSPTSFVSDVAAQQEYIEDGNAFNIFTPEDNTQDQYDIDMEDERAYLEFECSPKNTEYTFWFSNPELGSMTYIVITNPTDNDIMINYGKKNKDNTQFMSPVTELRSMEKAVVEVFHSLSADIISKVTIVGM